MSNEELAEAIKVTYARLIGTGTDKDFYNLLLKHLEELLKVQLSRATKLQTGE